MYFVFYLLIFSITVFLFIIATIKINNPFWNLMPVYHTYDFWRYLYKKNFIFGELVKNKHYDYLQVITKETNNIEEHEKKQIINLLQDHFLGTDKLLYTIDDKRFDALFNGCNLNSICSYYQKQKYTVNNSEIVISKDTNNIDATIISKKINFISNNEKIDAYFSEHICSHREDSNSFLKRRLLFSHIYNTLNMKPIECFIIKKNMNLFQNVIPISSCKTYVYKLSFYSKVDLKLFEIKKINSTNVDCIINLISNLSNNNKYFNILLYPDIGNLKLMLSENLIEIYTLTYKDNILAYYFFKNIQIHEEENEVDYISCISSINNCPNNITFVNGFMKIISDILRKSPEKNVIQIENFSHNSYLITHMNILYNHINLFDTAFYSINYFVAKTPNNSNSLITFF